MTAVDARALSRLLAKTPSNWGRWGAADEIGALNYLTTEDIHQVISYRHGSSA